MSPPEASRKTLKVKITLVLLNLSLVVAAPHISILLGGKLAREAVTESWFTFRLPDGAAIKEKILIEGSEEDTTVLEEDFRIIYDYSKGFVVMRTKGNGVNQCYLATFDRTRFSIPAVEEEKTMFEFNATMRPETDFYVQPYKIVDAAILSPRSREMCNRLSIYWMTRSMQASDPRKSRYKRRCRYWCYPKCTTWTPPYECDVYCGFTCPF